MKTSRERECVRESQPDWQRLFCREVRASLGYMVGSRPTSATVCRAPSQNQGRNKPRGGGCRGRGFPTERLPSAATPPARPRPRFRWPEGLARPLPAGSCHSWGGWAGPVHVEVNGTATLLLCRGDSSATPPDFGSVDTFHRLRGCIFLSSLLWLAAVPLT